MVIRYGENHTLWFRYEKLRIVVGAFDFYYQWHLDLCIFGIAYRTRISSSFDGVLMFVDLKLRLTQNMWHTSIAVIRRLVVTVVRLSAQKLKMMIWWGLWSICLHGYCYLHFFLMMMVIMMILLDSIWSGLPRVIYYNARWIIMHRSLTAYIVAAGSLRPVRGFV